MRPPASLRSDCSRCVGLCCVALPFGRSSDFAFDKRPGEACRHLGSDAGCGIHDRLRSSGMVGCTVFECFGAGQQVVQVTYAGHGELGPELFAVFGVVRQLHEMLVLLDQAAELSTSAASSALRERVVRLRDATPDVILGADLDALRSQVGGRLRQVSTAVRHGAGADLAGADLVGADLRSRDLRSADLRGALLVASDLRDTDLALTDLLGADLRDADLSGADLSSALFLTQPQINAARGSSSTRLPDTVTRPPHW